MKRLWPVLLSQATKFRKTYWQRIFAAMFSVDEKTDK